MAYPLYVLLPDGASWNEVPGTDSQGAAPVRWYLRQTMPTAATQTAVLVPGEGVELEQLVTDVAVQADQLGGVAVDARTQLVIDPSVGFVLT